MGVPRERIVQCPRSENFWQAGPTGPCGPCSELYLDRGVDHGSPEDLPGGENERFLEYWNLVFMQYDQRPNGRSRGRPRAAARQEHRHGLGLNRMAAILQDKPSVFETDQFQPLIELGEELSGRRYGEDFATDRALRILADHARAMTFLIGRRRGPVKRGPRLRAAPRDAPRDPAGPRARARARFPEPLRRARARGDGRRLPRAVEQADAIDMWLSAEEEGFGRTLARASQRCEQHIEHARAAGSATVPAEEVFRLHDTYGFPYEMTSELLAEEGLSIEGDFER